MEFYTDRVNLKLKHMKLQLANIVQTDDFQLEARSTKAGFRKAQQQLKEDYTHRIKSLWSYNVFDNPDYKDAQKIKKRVISWMKRRVSLDLHRQEAALAETKNRY